ncbi:MAG: hypothetical protein AMDU1_APLC00013G0071 [Thermoplasmatales archaeon A-plasma]|nr:MAG: hypothetical protein AMDU1_APLC00013G0071 [Thermoplasmatales archaeon A-plasma]
MYHNVFIEAMETVFFAFFQSFPGMIKFQETV